MNFPVFNRHRFLISEEDARALPPEQPYLAYVSYADWTDGNFHMMMHTHEDAAEVLLLLKGRGRYSVGLHRHQISAGDVVLIGSNTLHIQDDLGLTGENFINSSLQLRFKNPQSVTGSRLISQRMPAKERMVFIWGSGQGVMTASTEYFTAQRIFKDSLLRAFYTRKPRLHLHK